MLFVVGMGIGLMYFGVGELMQYFLKLLMVDFGMFVVVCEVMLMIFFYWGFYVWVIYGLMGFVFVYFGFCYNLLLMLCLGLYLVLCECINGWIGYIVDVFVLVGMVVGIVMMFGYGVMQLSVGLYMVVGWDMGSNLFCIGFVVVVVIFVGVLVVIGFDKGVCWLFELNLLFVFLLFVFVVVVGLMVFLLCVFGDNIGQYLLSFVDLLFCIYVYVLLCEEGWFGGWMIFYWVWWVLWLLFVGMFIVCILCGCMICQFVIGVLLVLIVFNFVWMIVFGNSVIWFDMYGVVGVFVQMVINVDVLLFCFFDFLLLL